MRLNDKHVQIIVELDGGNGEGPKYFFETPNAVETFVDEIASNVSYNDYLYHLDLAVDGNALEIENDFWMNIPIDRAIDIYDKIDFLREINYSVVGVDQGVDPFFPVVYVVVEGENGKMHRRYSSSSKENYDWWGEFLNEANEFLKSIDTNKLGQFKVYIDIAPEDTMYGKYIVKSRKRFLIAENAIRKLEYDDIEGMILASFQMFMDCYYDLCDDLYWFTNANAEKEKAKIFGDGYYHAVNFISSANSEAAETEQYLDFTWSVVEDGAASILEAVSIPRSKADTEIKAIAEKMQKKDSGELLEIDINSNWEDGLMRSVHDVPEEELVKFGDFITVIADKDYIASSLFEDEVLPLADELKVVIIYTDEARLTQDQLDKIPSYIVYDKDDVNRSGKTNAYLKLNK